MGHLDPQEPEDGEPLYCSAPQEPQDIIWAGSDTEQTPQAIHEKRLRYEKHARRYLRGQLPVLQSASIRGPLGKDWVNPWRYRPRQTPDWWQPASKEILFTRANVMRWATDVGLGHLTPKEALVRCKAAAEAQSSQAAEPLHDSTNADDSGSASSIDDQSEDSDDPLSQGNDLGILSSDPVHLEGDDGSGGPSSRGGGTKRRANLQWLKGSYVSKRARWDDPLVPSPSPNLEVPGAQGWARRGGSTRARTSTKAQIRTTTQSKHLRSSDHKCNGLKGVGLEQQEEDLDELGDISEGTIFVSTVGFLDGSKKAKPKPSTAVGSNHGLEKGVSPPKEPLITTPDYRTRSNTNSVELRSIKLQSLPRSRRDSAACDVDVLGDDSFITEVAPSSGNVEKFKYRKRRKRSHNRGSAESGLDVDEQRENPSKSPKPSENPMAVEPDETSSSSILINGNVPLPGESPNEEAPQKCEKYPRASSPQEFPPIEAHPIENIAVTEKEPSPISHETDSSWVMVNGINSPAGNSAQSSQNVQVSIGLKDEGLQSPVVPQPPEKHTPEEHAEDHSPASVQDDDITHSHRSSQTGPQPDSEEEIQCHMSSPLAEEIIQSQLRAEMDLWADAEESVDGDTGKEKQLDQNSSSEDGNRTPQNSDKVDENSQSHPSQEITGAEDAAVTGRNAATDAGNSTPRGFHGQQDSYQGGALQSPWAPDPSQLLPAVGAHEELEQGAIGSKGSGTPDKHSVVPDDSAPQHLARPQTPDHDGIIPFKSFMTPTPSPKLVRARPPSGGLPNTQTLVEAATSNPWVRNSERRKSKKRVSFGLPPEEEDLEIENTPKETPLSPPPPPTSNRPGEDFEDGTAVDNFQKHFAAVGGLSQRLRQKTNVPLLQSPAVSAMADAFIAADRELSAERGRQASPAGPLEPISDAMMKISGDNEGSSTGEPRPAIDLDGFLGEAGGFLEEWSVETELKKAPEGGSHRSDGEERRRRVLGGVW